MRLGVAAGQRLDAACAAVELYDNNPAVAFADLAASGATEVRLLRAVQAELATGWGTACSVAPARKLPDGWEAGCRQIAGPTTVAQISGLRGVMGTGQSRRRIAPVRVRRVAPDPTDASIRRCVSTSRRLSCVHFEDRRLGGSRNE